MTSEYILIKTYLPEDEENLCVSIMSASYYSVQLTLSCWPLQSMLTVMPSVLSLHLILFFTNERTNRFLNPSSMFQVSSMDQCLKVQEQLSTELHRQIKALTESEEEHTKLNEKQSEELKQLEEELKDLQSDTKEMKQQLRDAEAQILSLEKQKAELENAAQETKKEAEVNIEYFSL